MDDSYMIGKMNTFMHRLAEQMSGWLGTRLPKLTDEWWRDLVYNNLSQLQRDQVDQKNTTELKGLDLAALLRVFDRNWFVITSSWFVNNKERQKIRDMMNLLRCGDSHFLMKRKLQSFPDVRRNTLLNMKRRPGNSAGSDGRNTGFLT